ncbi:hypothetical protein F0562_002163 [Nyssa sinensis]|uniref:Cytochrome P450 n=1 Tax=Nyssa sinensis TaxID=561372 RepID=A0A5J5C5J4_9ASTE|nr:hypothetical protein F0562_002163 [Nyssa sinensis]
MEEMMSILIWLTVICLSSFCIHVYNILWMRPERLREKLRRQGIKGPPPSFLTGNVWEMKKIKSDLMAMKLSNEAVAGFPTANYSPFIFPYFEQWRQKYGPTYMYATGNVQNLYVTDPDLIKEICLFKSWDMGKPQYLIAQLKPLFGFGVSRANGQIWAHQRKIIAPQFFIDKLKGMVEIMVESALRMVKSWEDKVEKEGGQADIRVDEDLINFSTDAISKACFKSTYSKGTNVFELIRLLERAISRTPIIIRLPIIRYLPTKTNREVWRLEKEIEKLILKQVADGRERSDDEKDLLPIILEGTVAEQLGEERANRFVVDNCKNIYIAGHETVSSVATWTLMLLAAFPEWQARSRAEVISIFQGHPPDADSLHKLKTLTMVIQEAMRLYPPTSFIAREALEDMKLGDIYIPKGVNLWIPITTLHRLPELWGEDVDEFKPERFAHGIYGSCKFPQAYLPFGNGPRSCLGQKFAMMELKVLLSNILSKFSLSISPKYHHSPSFRMIIEPKYGMQIILKKLSV